MSARSALLRPYYPAVDGLRAVSIALVFAIHFGYTYFPEIPFFSWGWIGVDIFFVISGFLITGILYDTLQRPDFFRNFYLRRALRIFPLYYLVLLAIGAFSLMPFVHVYWTRWHLLYFIYLANLVTPKGNAGILPNVQSLYYSVHGIKEQWIIGLGPYWSLCVEEQFYLLWPAVLWIIRSRRAALALCIFAMVAAPVARLHELHADPRLFLAGATYFQTWFRADLLFAGSAIALWLRGPTPQPATLRRLACGTIIVSTALLVIGWHFSGPHPARTYTDRFIGTLGYSLLMLAICGLLLLALDSETFVARVLATRPLVSLGRISYGLYIFHGLVLLFLLPIGTLLRVHFGIPSEWMMVVGPIVSYALARLSFRYIESPFLTLKSRFAPRAGAVDDPPPIGRTKLIERR